MHDGLERLIDDYLAAIEQAIGCLESNGIPRPVGLQDWLDRDFPQVGKLADGTEYFKHGCGININIRPHAVDFDFGPNGETDAVDLHFMIHFARNRLPGYGFISSDEVIQAFRASIADGDLVPLTTTLYRRA